MRPRPERPRPTDRHGHHELTSRPFPPHPIRRSCSRSQGPPRWHTAAMGAARRILVDPDPRLRAPARAVHLPDKGLRRLIDDMVVTMRKANGVGLAAPQIGEPLRLAVVEVKGLLTIIGNPAVVKTGFPAVDWEGCLSIPERVAQVRRAAEIVIVADDIEGRRVRHRAD